MINSRFSNLVYRIIGKPEINQDEYASIMNNALQEMDLFTDPSHFSELEIGNQILSRIENSDDAIRALSALLDNGRFKIIILNEELKPIYHNSNAKSLLDRLTSGTDKDSLNAKLLTAIKSKNTQTPEQSDNPKEELISLDYFDQNEQIYLKTITNKDNSGNSETSHSQLLLAIDQTKQNPLSAQLTEKYQFTQKEQQILIGLIHGNNVKEIANKEFISENTVRTHLKSLFRKTDTNSQTQIVGLMLSHESQVLNSYFSNKIDIADSEFQKIEDQTVTLRNGHQLTYCDYGPNEGNPLIIFHNTYGSRIMVPRNYHEICEKTNRRIIIIDRPGYGKTDFIKGHPANWPLMLNEFIDLLKIQSYEVLGNVLGCSLAIEFAHQADQRLKRLILTSPFFINKEEDSKHLLGILAPSQMLVKGSARFARQVYELWLKSVTLNLNTHYRNMVISGAGKNELAQFEREGTIDIIVNCFREASKQTLKGISHEMQSCLTPSNLDLSKITIPVDLWWGTEDVRFTREGVEELAEQLPNSNIQIKEGYSEHIYYALFEEIINTN